MALRSRLGRRHQRHGGSRRKIGENRANVQRGPKGCGDERTEVARVRRRGKTPMSDGGALPRPRACAIVPGCGALILGKAVARKPAPRRAENSGLLRVRNGHVHRRTGRDRRDRGGDPERRAVPLWRRRRMRALRAPLRGISRHQTRRADRERHLRADRGRDRARDRPGRRGPGAGAHLHGDRDGGARRGRDPGDRRRRREHHDRSRRARGRDRPAHQGGDPGPHVGCRLRHGPDHEGRRPARPARARGRLPGDRRRLSGPDARHDRPGRCLQLQLL